MNMQRILALLCVAVLTGCGSFQHQNTARLAKRHYQRFVPVPADGFFTEGVPWHGYFALDTKTGSLCITLTSAIKTFKGPSEWANDVPNCSRHLADDPD